MAVAGRVVGAAVMAARGLFVDWHGSPAGARGGRDYRLNDGDVRVIALGQLVDVAR